MHHWAERAVSAAKVLGDPSLLAAALAMPALADAMTGPTDRARSHRSKLQRSDELSDEELSLRPDAASWLAAAELSTSTPRPMRTEVVPPVSLARTRGSLVPPVSDPAQDLVRARQAGRGRRTPRRRHRGRAPGRVSAGSPGTSSSAPSSQSPSAISTSRSPPPKRQSSSRATSTTASSRPGLR